MLDIDPVPVSRREATDFFQNWTTVAELEEDLAASRAETESERVREIASTAVGVDEPVHEGPGVLGGVG